MIAGTYNINIPQGSTCALTVTLKDSAGVVINIAGYTFASQIRKTYGGTLIASFTCAVVGDGSAGQMTISLTAAQTTLLLETSYVYDLKYTNGSTIKRVMQGEVTISQEVTI